jgi:hypothetical protein
MCFGPDVSEILIAKSGASMNHAGILFFGDLFPAIRPVWLSIFREHAKLKLRQAESPRID